MKKYTSRSFWLDADIEQVLGNMLRFGVILAAVVTTVGGVLYLINSGGTPHPSLTRFGGAPAANTSLKAILVGVVNLRSSSIMLLGVLLLIATPIVRVLFSFFAFLLEKDYLYVVLTLVVLFIIGFSIFGGFA
jgi:uncharacterized membrane protein